jgi:YVTN family beta-propeller protein
MGQEKIAMIKTYTLEIVILFLLILFSCGRKVPFQPQTGDKGVYVLNGISETLSFYDFESKSVWNNVDTTGTYPNQIVIRKEMAYIVNSGSANLQILDIDTNQEMGSVDLGSGSNPWSIALVDNSKAYVSLFVSDQVAVLDLVGNQVVKNLPVGKSPEGIVVAQNKLYVCNTGYEFSNYGEGSVSVISIENDSLLKTIPVGTNPQVIGLDEEGELHVVCTGNFLDETGKVYIIEPENDVVTDSIEIGGYPGFLAFAPNGKAYLGEPFIGILSYDTRSNAVLHDESNPILPGISIFDVAVDLGGNLYACYFDEDSLFILDTEGDTLIKKVGVGDGPLALAIKEGE